MSKIIVKDNVRYTAKDAERIDVTPVQTKVAIEGTDAWAAEQAEAARAELQAELDAKRAEFVSQLEQERAAFDAELATKRTALEQEFADRASVATANGSAPKDEEKTTKVVEPAVTKDRKPSTTKSGTAASE